jgi:hypothetical protein
MHLLFCVLECFKGFMEVLFCGVVGYLQQGN